MAHSCAFNQTTKQPYCGCNLGWPESTYDTAVIPNATDYCSAYESKEEEFVYQNALGALVDELSPTEFCNFIANRTDNDTTGEEGLRRRRSLLAPAAGEVYEDGIHIVPEFTTFRCEGPFYAGSCGDGTHPAISYSALHQVHLLLFTIAAMHVLISVIVAIIAGMRIRQWRRWQDVVIKNGPQHLINKTTSGISGPTLAGSSGSAGDIDGSGSNVSNVAVGEVKEIENSTGKNGVARRRYDTLLSNLEENPLPLEEAARRPTDTAVAAIPEDEDAPTTAPPSVAGSVFVSEVQDAAKNVQRRWIRRDSRLLRKRHRLGEMAICLGQALLPNLVSQYEFSTMRVAYIGSHNLPETFDWVDVLMHHLDFDLHAIIGASIVTWAIFICEWLFSGLAGWVSSVFMLIACIAVLAINIWLVAAIRFSCRGGRPHRIRNVSRWYNNPGWLCIPIGGIIFLCSTTFATALFFWWQFGGSSCFFTNEHQQIWRWLPGDLPWYCGLIGPAVLLVWMGYVTIPAWALVMHMRPKAIIIEGKKGSEGEDVEEAPEVAQQVERQVSGVRTQAVVMAEIQKLQNELMELQAPS
jgi:hypothetical protein